MAYHQQQPSQHAARPRHRGLKRTLVGALGLASNVIGVFVMPWLVGIIGLGVAGTGAMQLTPLDAEGDTIDSSFFSVYAIVAPVDEADGVSCEFSGAEVQVTGPETTPMTYEHHGVQYVEVYSIIGESGVVDVQCEGSDAVAVSEIGFGGTVLGIVLSVVIPIVLGVLSLGLMIWGIIALLISTSRR